MDMEEAMDPQKVFNHAVRSVLVGCIERSFVLPFQVVFVGANDASHVCRFRGPDVKSEPLAEYEDSNAMMALPVNVTVCDQRGAIARTVIDIQAQFVRMPLN
jgi:hypothetical protein